MYSQGIEYEEEVTRIGDEEKGFEEWFEQKSEEFCMCNLFIIITQILSMIELKKIIKRE